MTVEEHLLTFKKAGFISQRNLPRRKPESDGGREALGKTDSKNRRSACGQRQIVG